MTFSSESKVTNTRKELDFSMISVSPLPQSEALGQSPDVKQVEPVDS